MAFPATRSVCASNCKYKTIQSAVDASSSGDTISVSPETFIGTNGTFKIFNKNDITVQVSTPGSYFTIDCSSGMRDGKGCVYLDSTSAITIDGAKIINASDSAAAGSIRIDRGRGNFAVKNCWLKDGRNHGILAGAPSKKGSYDISIDNTIFDNFGASGGGQEHGIYIGAYNNLYVRGCYFINIQSGHNIKTRAKNNWIEYNKVVGGSLYANTNSVDISCGGIVYAIGNVFEKGSVFVDGVTSADMFRIGKDLGPSCPTANGWTVPTQVYVVNNTFLHDLPPNGTLSWGFIYRSPAAGSWPSESIFQSKNNIHYFKGTTSSYKVVDPTGRAPDETSNVLVNDVDPGWVHKTSDNYNLLPSASMLIDQGTAPGMSVGGYSLTPQWMYAETAGRTPRSINGIAIDIGAYEFNTNPESCEGKSE